MTDRYRVYAACFALFWNVLAVAAQEPTANAQGAAHRAHPKHSPATPDSSPGHIVSRVIHLYYYRDAARVASIINSSARQNNKEETDSLRRQVDDTRSEASRLASSIRAADTQIQLHATAQAPQSSATLIPVGTETTAPKFDAKLIDIIGQRQQLASEESALRQKLFRLESELAEASDNSFVIGDREAADPVSQVSLTVVGEGELHLRGPQNGVNKVVRIIHQVDKPVGQVKVRLHTVQVNGEKGDAMEAVHDAIDAHINHARALTVHAGLLFPRAVSKVYAEIAQDKLSKQDCTFFCRQFQSEFEKINSDPDTEKNPLKIESIDGSSLLGALYMAALAEDDIRKRIFQEFIKSASESLVADELHYFEMLKRAESRDRFAGGLLFGRYLEKAQIISSNKVESWARQSFDFANLRRLIDSQSTGIEAFNSVQSATIQLAKGLQNLYVLETELHNLVLERSLFERTAGEVEAKAHDSKRRLELSQAKLLKESNEAEVMVASVIATVLTGLNEITLKKAELNELQKTTVERFLPHLNRLANESVQKELAPVILKVILDSTRGAAAYTDEQLAETIYDQIALHMQDALRVVFGLTVEENHCLRRLAVQQIVPKTEKLRTAARQWTLAKERMVAAEAQYHEAVLHNELCYRQLFAKRVLDQFIDEQEEKVSDIWENLRPHVATIDSYLKQMAIAFEDDVNEQFYKPAFQDIRRAARDWDVSLGQIETTTILTNDRTPARVSPAQTIQFDLPKRQMLIQEAVNGAEAVTNESRTLLAKLGIRSAATAAGPGATALAGSVPVGAPFGEQLNAQVPASRLYTLEAGNDFEITPVIQPDGHSIAYQFDYVYTSNISEPTRPDERGLPQVKRHFVKTEVQTSNYELREISRFRVATSAAKIERGMPLFGDIPLVGRLFRPAASRGVALQENIILADCVVYPTVFDLTGRRWLKPAEYIKTAPLLAANVQGKDRQQQLRNKLLSITREEVENLLSLPLGSGSATSPSDNTEKQPGYIPDIIRQANADKR